MQLSEVNASLEEAIWAQISLPLLLKRPLWNSTTIFIYFFLIQPVYDNTGRTSLVEWRNRATIIRNSTIIFYFSHEFFFCHFLPRTLGTPHFLQPRSIGVCVVLKSAARGAYYCCDTSMWGGVFKLIWSHGVDAQPAIDQIYAPLAPFQRRIKKKKKKNILALVWGASSSSVHVSPTGREPGNGPRT